MNDNLINDKMIYFDNAATTPVCNEAKRAVVAMLDNFGNPSSPYGLGVAAKNEINKSAASIEKIIKAEKGSFYFTSCATESNNWAIFGTAEHNVRAGKHVVTAKTEHPSVIEPFKILEKRGFSVTYIDADRNGNVDTEQLFAAISDDTILVSLMNVNNETGVITDVASIGKRIKHINGDTVFHVDGVQAFCKIPISVQASNIDLFSVSGHKLHSPKGIGGLYVKNGTRISPYIYGGSQQKNMRSGTENTVLIKAFAESAEMLGGSLTENLNHVNRIKETIIEGISQYPFAEINGGEDIGKNSPYILNIGFRGYKSQILINALEQQGIYASAGSACSSNTSKSAYNKSLSALGLDKELVEGAVRFSFSKYNTVQEANTCLMVLCDIFNKYKR